MARTRQAHQEQLREWAENYPPTFADKHALVSVARIESETLTPCVCTSRLSIRRVKLLRPGRGPRPELAQYCLARGLETAGYVHLRSARNCYDRWGAHGKAKATRRTVPATTGRAISHLFAHDWRANRTIGCPRLVKASQALSEQMLLPRLIEKLIAIAVEHAGAEQGLLILVRAGEPWIEAEATTGPGKVEVVVRRAAVTPSDLPQSALHYVIRTQGGRAPR